MKIGILINRFEDLANWELRIIKEIMDNPKNELSFLIQYDRKKRRNTYSFKNKVMCFFRSENKLGELLFRLQRSVENLMYRKHFTVDKKSIISRLETIDTIKLYTVRKGSADILEDYNGRKIPAFDLILKFEPNTRVDSLSNAAKYGIWSFHYGEWSGNCSSLAGFWEIIFQRPDVKVTLQQSTSDVDRNLIIDKASFNRHWSFVKTNRLVLEASVSLLLKNIGKVARGSYGPSSTMVNFNPQYKLPTVKDNLRYIRLFYGAILGISVRYINSALFGARYGCWTLFIGEGDFMNATLFKLSPTVMPKNEFWADPFLIDYKGEKYIFFENYSYKTKKGKISCGTIKNKELVNVRDVLDLEYHLSFPFIFKENEELFLMPETKGNNRLELYKCIGFPDKWELYATAFEGEKVVDAFFYDDEKAQKWLFVNKQADLYTPADSELYIYRVESLNLHNLEPHRLNPVIISSRHARNGGAIFNYKDGNYRPSQANIDGIYGRALNINKIEKLTIDEYIEKDVLTVYPSFHKDLIAMHHLHQTDGLFVIDAAYRKM